MFTGIIETLGKLISSKTEGSNVRFTFESSIASELKVDQSVSHNGVCLTVVAINGNTYDVVAIDETLKRSNLSMIREGDEINLERSLKIGDRLDGHFVQGHIDTIARVDEIISKDGSWIFHFSYDDQNYITVEKGSICINGVSLTIVDSGKKTFSVAIIPYTMEHTNFHTLKKGSIVNLEFDILGKYITRIHEFKNSRT